MRARTLCMFFLRGCLFGLFAFSPFFCSRLFQEASGWSRWLELKFGIDCPTETSRKVTSTAFEVSL